MKKLETPQSVALILKNSFASDLVGFKFAEEAKLVTSKHIQEGPAWVLEAECDGRKVLLFFETFTKYAYCYPGSFTYTEVSPTSELQLKDQNGLNGVVEERNGKAAIVWG